MELEEQTKSNAFLTDLALETTKSVVITAATVAAAYGAALIVVSIPSTVRKVKAKFTSKKSVDTTPDETA